MASVVAPCIAVVEDDPDLCQGWIDLFEMLGYKSRGYHSAQDLFADLDYLASCGLLITDYYLPDTNGVELILQARKHYKDLPAILLTGSREAAVSDAARVLGNCSVVFKPINIDDLEREVQRVCDRGTAA